MSQAQNIPADSSQAGTPATVLIARVRWLMRLRWVYVALAVALAYSWLFETSAFAYVAGVLVAQNAAFFLVLRRLRQTPTPNAAATVNACVAVQVAIDLACLVAMMVFTGGAINPLTALLVLEIAVASSLLSRRAAYLEALLGSVLFLAGGLIAGHVRPEGMLASIDGLRAEPFSRLVVWDWLGLTIVVGSLFLTVAFVNAILTRLRRINDRLAEANRHLAGLDLAKSRFLRVSSHQLRSPLAAIHAMISAVQEVGGFNPKQYELMLKIRSRADEIMAQLDEMMLLSTIKENAAETQRLEPVEVGRVLTETAGEFKEQAAQRNVAMNVSAQGGLVVQAWEDAVETILEHLLSNAVKYVGDGGRVEVSARGVGASVEITVTDDGIGIPLDQQERVFHEFFRATNARQVCGGTGLGLSIVHAIVERLGGRIEFKSQESQGTTVRVTLPRAPRTTTASVESAKSEASPHGTSAMLT